MSILTNGQSRILDPSGRPFPMRDVYGDMALPHVLTFPSLYGSAWKTYLHGKWDEAMRHSRENALELRRDAFLMALLQERKLATVSLKWHLEVDDEKDPYQKALKDGLMSMLQATRRLRQMKYYLLEALWYGRYAAQVRWEWRTIDVPAVAFQPPVVGPMGAAPGGMTTVEQQRRYLHLVEHQPVNGDKIGHEWDGTPYVHIYAGARETLRELQGRGAKIKTISSTEAAALVLDGTWRERFIIHQHEVDDADYFEAERADSLYGIGIRHRIHWLAWMRREYLSMVVDYLQRKGLGIDIFWFDEGNPAARRKMEEVAHEQSYRSIILLPKPAGSAGRVAGNEFQRVETNVSGAELLLKMQNTLDEQIQRYIVGQTMSGGADDASGLGGTGRAQFAANTKHKIIQWDAGNLDETLTDDWLRLVQRWSYPEYADLPVRHVTNVPDEEAKDKLDAAKSAWEMGVDLVTNEVRGLTGLSDPQPGDEVLEGKAAGPALPPGMDPFGGPEGEGASGRGGQRESGRAEEDEDLTPEGVGEPVPFARGGDCQWITIGGTRGADGQRKGGSPVCVQGGRIVRGHPSLTGKRIAALEEGGAKEAGPEEAERPTPRPAAPPARPRHRLVEGDPGSHRQQLAQSRGHARAVWAKKARQAGLPSAHLHQLAAELIAHDREYAASLTRMLGEARRMSVGSGFGDLRTLAARARRGDIDASHIRGLDDTAQSMAARYPELFPDAERADERLFELLLAGNPEPMAEEDAYTQAFEHLQARQPSPAATWATTRPTEEAPFQRGGAPAHYAGPWQESAHPRDEGGQFTEQGGGAGTPAPEPPAPEPRVFDPAQEARDQAEMARRRQRERERWGPTPAQRQARKQAHREAEQRIDALRDGWSDLQDDVGEDIVFQSFYRADYLLDEAYGADQPEQGAERIGHLDALRRALVDLAGQWSTHPPADDPEVQAARRRRVEQARRLAAEAGRVRALLAAGAGGPS